MFINTEKFTLNRKAAYIR